MPEIGTIKESSWSQIGGGCLKSHKKLVWARRVYLVEIQQQQKRIVMQNLKGARKKDTHFALVKTWLEKKSFLGAENKPFDRKKT